MAAISQTTYSMTFPGLKMFKLRLKFHRSMFPISNWRYFIIDPENSLAPKRRQAIIWTRDNIYDADVTMPHCVKTGYGRLRNDIHILGCSHWSILNFIDGLAKLPLVLCHWLRITNHSFIWILWLLRAPDLIFVKKRKVWVTAMT